MTARILVPRLVLAAATLAAATLCVAGLGATRDRFSAHPPHLVVTAHPDGVVDVRADGAALTMATVAVGHGSAAVDRCPDAWRNGRCPDGAVRVRSGLLGPLARGETAHLRLRGTASASTFAGAG
jgi:hypothetical protein